MKKTKQKSIPDDKNIEPVRQDNEFDDEQNTYSSVKESKIRRFFKGAGIAGLTAGGGILYILFNILHFVFTAVVGLGMIWLAITLFLDGSIIWGLLVLLIGTPLAIGLAHWLFMFLFILAILALILWGIASLFGFNISFDSAWDIVWTIVKILILGGLLFFVGIGFVEAIKERKIISFLRKNWFYILLFIFLLWFFFLRGFSYHKIEFTPEEEKQVIYFGELIEKRDMALGVVEEASEESLKPTFSLTPEQSERHSQYLKEAYAYCDKIDDATLEKIHLDLPYHFRNELCQHLYLDIENLEIADGEEMNPKVIEKQIRAFELSWEFINWYNSNRNEFNVF